MLWWLGIANPALAVTLGNFARGALHALEAGVSATAQVTEVTLLAWWLPDEPLSPTRLLAAHIQQSKLEVRHITLDMIYRARQR